MNSLIWQLRSWQLRERLVRLAWGGARWFAVVAVVLAFACLADWLFDRRTDVPKYVRVGMTLLQAGIAAALAYWFLIRPWARTPGIDDLAYQAEQAIPEFDHRLVTALQLNRRGARTQGMSPALIAEVTREAGEMAARHRLTQLIDYKPVLWALAVAAPVVLLWGGFILARPALSIILLKRQMLLDVEIPRSVQLENITPPLWPSGSEVEIRYRVTGEWDETMAGTVFIRPDGQPVDDYRLVHEKSGDDGSATFLCKLPPSSTGFSFTARLADGRTRTNSDRVDFEPPPQVQKVTAMQLLPSYLGTRKDGSSFERLDESGGRGEIVNALPLSGIRVEAKFNKAVKQAVLIPLERGEGNREVEGKRLAPIDLAEDGLSAEWVFPAAPKSIGYRIELIDTRGFKNPAPFRRGIRMLPDEPPNVEFKKETTRNPDPNSYYGKGDPTLYQWDFPVALVPGIPGESDTGPIQVIYSASSELGIGRVNIAYRVIPRGADAENIHPRDDPTGRVFTRLPLTRTLADQAKLGKWMPDLGLFEKSWSGFSDKDPRRFTSQVEFFPLPSADPSSLPGELEAGGRYYFQTGGLRKKSADGVNPRLEVGDTIEMYMEVFDKYAVFLEGKKTAGPPRLAGYTREAKRKTIISEDDYRQFTIQQLESQKKLQDKLRAIADDQRGVFQPKK